MTLVRSVIGAFVAALLAGAAGADALRVAGTCPKDTVACLDMHMHWDLARTDKPPFKADGSLSVRGRLGDGEVQAYQLVLSGTALRGLDLGGAAYLGRSKDGRPIIVTDRGPLAIETRGVHMGRGGAVVIVDTRAGKVAREYFGGLAAATYVITDAKKIGVLTKRGTCLTPPSARPGALKIVANCGGPEQQVERIGFSERLAGSIIEAPDADLAQIRRLLPQTADLDDETLRLKIGRIDGRYLVVTPW